MGLELALPPLLPHAPSITLQLSAGKALSTAPYGVIFPSPPFVPITLFSSGGVPRYHPPSTHAGGRYQLPSLSTGY